MLKFVVLLAAVLAVKGQTTNVNRCTVFSGDLPLNIHIEGCVDPPCLLPQFQNAVINIIFRAPRTMTTMRTMATAFLGFIPVPYDLGQNANTCNFLTNSFCPVLEGEVLQYTLKMFIESFMVPGTQVTVEFRVVDQNNSSFLCVRVPIRIVPAVPQLTGDNRLPSAAKILPAQ